MTQQKIRLSKLFSIITLCAFCTGLIVGIFSTLHFINFSEKETSKIPTEENINRTSIEKDLDFNANGLDKNETESLKRYKKMLQNSLENPVKDEETLVTYYGVLMGNYKSSDRANNFAINLKDQYNWNVAVYPIKNLHHVIVGPFYNKTEAQDFLDQLPQQARFIKAQVVLFPHNN